MHSCICQTTLFVSRTSDVITKTLTHVNTQAPEASLAEVCWLGSQSDLQKEAEERLKQLDVAQERKRGKVTELQKQALPEEARLADTMRDVVGREMRKGESDLHVCVVLM